MALLATIVRIRPMRYLHYYMKRLATALSVFAGLSLAVSAQAVCPVCTVAVSAGIGLSRWLGVDDIVTGVWVGGLIVSVSIWTLDWLGKKKLRFQGDQVSVAALYYLFALVPLWYSGLIGHPLNTLWGVDKLLLGTGTGSVAFVLAAWLHEVLKKRNGGKSYFPFQKVALPVSALAVTSSLAYIIKCACA
jgi:hypothetical protein